MKPLHIKRSNSTYYKDLISSHLIDTILREHHIMFTKNLDVTSFSNNRRKTHNPQGRAVPSVVWDYFLNGCSIRLINPQTYIPELHLLNASLQEFFHCFVGSNSYLTPPNSQGFAPHYDDIEAFILQVEGKKRWRLYKPRCNEETLPRYSSPNFSQRNIGEPILDTIVEPGDLLYFPRGTIHQGDTFGLGHHSLHVTLSVYQKNTWGDFLEKSIPAALQSAIQTDIRFRKGLPLYYLRRIGFAFANEYFDIHKKFLAQVQSLLNILVSEYLNIDETADELAKNHIHDFLPPMLNKQEYYCSVYGGGERMTKSGTIVNRVQFKPSTSIRLSRAHCIRLVMERNSYRIYYSCDNSKEYHEYELQYLEIHPKFIDAIKKIILQFPSFMKVKDLPIKNHNYKVQFVSDLWEKGILVCEKPFF
ncbi:bifunctional lysine-specific demethylase and histidyl-hydroxylase NO66 isoform X1 [Copidosoma floridanum]|uniref:bifunctional lysine-specific demethylase and histidyl-hydroxylase NO66 isoform X1 n=1 Tax=Copidosoma floridanum TaxID=29053 RepID=UPI0006C9B2CD|nr:bifunctional lysine-specific demethylase and histidyl-hydroxylase NO66 isoform X1 [Copidosoma floridanum]